MPSVSVTEEQFRFWPDPKACPHGLSAATRHLPCPYERENAHTGSASQCCRSAECPPSASYHLWTPPTRDQSAEAVRHCCSLLPGASRQTLRYTCPCETGRFLVASEDDRRTARNEQIRSGP